jgi:hypothetical protein
MQEKYFHSWWWKIHKMHQLNHQLDRVTLSLLPHPWNIKQCLLSSFKSIWTNNKIIPTNNMLLKWITKISSQTIVSPILLEILLFTTHPCATTCNAMSHVIINRCLCEYFSNLDEVWYSFQLGYDYDLFHP